MIPTRMPDGTIKYVPFEGPAEDEEEEKDEEDALFSDLEVDEKITINPAIPIKDSEYEAPPSPRTEQVRLTG